MNKKERLDALKKGVLNGISMEEMKQAKKHFQENPGTLDLGNDEVSVKRRRIGRAGMLWMYHELYSEFREPSVIQWTYLRLTGHL